MKMNKTHLWRILMLAAIVALSVFALSGCSNSPDSVEDPLSQYSGMGVDSLVPFPTTSPGATVLPTATPAPTQEGYRDLIFGDTGEAVSALQGRLKALGYFGGAIDGKFGESTSSAIKLFQAQMSQQKTGLATALLQQQLFDANAPRYATGSSAAEEDPYDGPVGDLPDDYEDYSDPVPTKKPAATKAPSSYDETDSYDDSPRELARGDKGQLVRDLQTALKRLGYYTGSVDGDYGSGTVTAVKRFQAVYGQSQTGVATLALQRKLYSGDAVPYATPTPKPTSTTEGYKELAWGDTGTDVTRLQRRLKALGYLDTATAGTYDDNTEKAVKRFQRMYGATESGVATVALQKRLFAATAPTYKPATSATPKPDDYQKLQPGSTGEAVKALQRRLRELGFFEGDIGGNYLDLTTTAVKRFQRAIGVDTTGIATPSLQRVIFSDDAPYYDVTTPTPRPTQGSADQLVEGDKGDHVTKVQKRLKELGYYSGTVTGGFGAGTTAAVKAFQKAIDVTQSGIVDRDLYAFIMSDEAPSKAKPVVTPAADPTYKKLEPGATGDAVKTLQKRLRELGYFDGDIGGNYLTKTTNAVKAFQKKIGWDQTGIATTDLQEKLFSKNAPLKGESEGEMVVDESELRALKYKDTGARVSDLQNRLIELGFLDSDFGGDKQGTYGRATQTAVIDAQLSRGFDSDGNADLEFMRFIMSGDAENLQPIVY